MEQALSLLLPGPNGTPFAIKSEMHKELKTIVWLKRFLCEKHNEFNSPNIRVIPEDVFMGPAFLQRMMTLTKQIRNIQIMTCNTELEKETAIDALLVVQEALVHEAEICEW
jgi:hypothetical protein